MRYIYLGLLLLFSLTASNVFASDSVKLTMYDDGKTCPSSCDAHVVFHPSMNGTEFAHPPNSTGKPYGECELGMECEVCLEAGGKQCLISVYRGSGPSKNTFDFTPAFYASACEAIPSQTLLAGKCRELKVAANSLSGRRNCISEPMDPLCRDLMEAATIRRETDSSEYDKCIKKGEKEYNRTQPVENRRSIGCAYEYRGTGGPNSFGTTWKRLLPGACREGTFVGRDGLDCCGGNTFSDGSLGVECIAFYPRPR